MAVTQTTTNNPAASTGLQGTTFQRVTEVIKRRVVMSVEGDWGTGKTDFALSAPGPIAFFRIDPNSEWTLGQYAGKKEIYASDVRIPKSDSPGAQAASEAVWATFQKDYAAALASKTIRTVIWDTATELWELCRLAAFGKLANVMPHHYVQVNGDFRGLIKNAFDSDTNLIMVHKLKDEWVNQMGTDGKEKGKRTGKKERAGFADMGFACQIMVQTEFDKENGDSPFTVKVLKCTQNPMLTGNYYGQIGDLRMNAFPFIASDVFPGTGLEAWT